MLEVLVVLYDCADGVMVAVEGEAVVPHVVVRESLDEVQSKHRWYATQSTKDESYFLFHSDSVNIVLLTKKVVTVQQKCFVITKVKYYFLILL